MRMMHWRVGLILGATLLGMVALTSGTSVVAPGFAQTQPQTQTFGSPRRAYRSGGGTAKKAKKTKKKKVKKTAKKPKKKR
jgi:hypothetical protein